jgi:regulator of ribonuclease activity A
VASEQAGEPLVQPRKSTRGLHSGQAGIPVVFAGVVVRDGEWLCADRDGIVVLYEAPPWS